MPVRNLLRLFSRCLGYRRRNGVLRDLLQDFRVRHQEASAIISADDLPKPSDALLDLCLSAIDAARSIDLSDIAARLPPIPGKKLTYVEVWPGEHYKLLAGFVKILRPLSIVEIGTYQGTSAASMAKFMPAGAQLHTFDIVPWQTVPGAILDNSHIESGQIVQIIGNLADPAVYERHRRLLENADLFFIDAPKDYHTEKAILTNFRNTTFAKTPLMIFDDIRVMNMIELWRDLGQDQIDLTSFGHWSGTGVVRWI